ncbi:WxL domain-containing protein [Lysinibacillus sp. NPDC059133]|uniref:WxL domain-containing protein n=1 Tax=Lysinibacillus sp. NPDC059133 TaxID=3346737 RepID=UPI0036926537
MKKIDLKMLGITALVTGSVLAGSTTSFAGGGAQTDGTYDSKTVVKFQAPGEGGGEVDPVEPVDPTDPTKPVDPKDPPGEGTPGPLSIDFASNLKFGTPEISSKNQTYKVQPQKFNNRVPEDGPNYVQVTDNRGTLKGWKLTLTQMGQLKTEDGNELTGAAINFENGHVASTVDEEFRPSGNQEFTLQLGEDGKGVAENIMVADAGKGAGTFLHVFGGNDSAADSITLTVPGKTIKHADKDYSTKLKWTLSDVPSGNEGEESGSEGEE